MDGGTRHMMARIEAHKGNQLPNIPKGANIAAFRQQFADGRVAPARNGAQQVGLLLEGGVLVEQIGDRPLGLSDLRIQQTELVLPVLDDGTAQTRLFQMVFRHLACLRQIVQVSHQLLQLAHFWRRWRPGLRLLGATKISDKGRIQFIRLIALHLTGGIALNPRRIDYAHGVTLRVQILSHRLAIAARRFQAHMHWLGLQPSLQPPMQFLMACRRVRELLPFPLAFSHQQYVQPPFTHIDPHIAVHLASLPSASVAAYLVCKLSVFLYRASDTVRLLLGHTRPGRDVSFPQTSRLRGCSVSRPAYLFHSTSSYKGVPLGSVTG